MRTTGFVALSDTMTYWAEEMQSGDTKYTARARSGTVSDMDRRQAIGNIDSIFRLFRTTGMDWSTLDNINPIERLPQRLSREDDNHEYKLLIASERVRIELRDGEKFVRAYYKHEQESIFPFARRHMCNALPVYYINKADINIRAFLCMTPFSDEPSQNEDRFFYSILSGAGCAEINRLPESIDSKELSDITTLVTYRVRIGRQTNILLMEGEPIAMFLGGEICNALYRITTGRHLNQREIQRQARAFMAFAKHVNMGHIFSGNASQAYNNTHTIGYSTAMEVLRNEG